MRPCFRCGADHGGRLVSCAPKVWKVGARVRQLVGVRRTGTVLNRPKWLKAEPVAVLVEWDDGLNPTQSTANVGWLTDT